MPELPEVEVLVRHLAPLLKGRTIRSVRVNRTKVLGGVSARHFTRALLGESSAAWRAGGSTSCSSSARRGERLKKPSLPAPEASCRCT